MTLAQDVTWGRVLFEEKIPQQEVADAFGLLGDCPELTQALVDPTVSVKEKHAVIARVFSGKIADFIRLMCDHNQLERYKTVYEAYQKLMLDSAQIAEAELCYATKPSEEQLDKLKAMICRKFEKKGVALTLREEPALLGGFVLKVGDYEFDRSIKNSLSMIHKRLIRR